MECFLFSNFQKKRCNPLEISLPEQQVQKSGYYKCRIRFGSNCCGKFQFLAIVGAQLPVLGLNEPACAAYEYFHLCGYPTSIFVP